MKFNFKNKIVLITGGEGGLGKSICSKFIQLGAKVIVTTTNKKLINKKTKKKSYVYLDFNNRNSIQKFSNDLKKINKIDILINNAGAIPPGNISDINEDTWRNAWDLKVFGYINLTRLIYNKMKDAKKGVILNIIGSAGQKPMYNYIAGTTANAGLMAFTKALSNGSTANGIRVLGINPGFTTSDRLITMMKGKAKEQFNDESRWEELFKDLPFKRAAKAEEVADLTTFLVSPRCDYISGTIIAIDAGHANH